jgi:5-methylcytosine-specific restriction protein B
VNSNGNLNILTTEGKNFQGTMTKEKLERFAAGENTFAGWEGYASGVIKHLKEKFQLSEKSSENKKKNFVLIIDEINRGNVSQIFGELITLIEEDKRAGKHEALQVVLPYSKEPFSVPSNLYIVGTMNTADRSVEAIDTALRRRFSFIEMPPLPDLIDEKTADGIKLREILTTINSRLEILLDKDHLIGHSYFIHVKSASDLQSVFHDNIIPLLQEYFYGDYGKIGLVLGVGFFDEPITSNKTPFAKFHDYDASGLEERQIFKLKKLETMSTEDFIDAVNTLIG